MSAQQWYVLAGFLLTVGAAVFAVTQVMLARWRKQFER